MEYTVVDPRTGHATVHYFDNAQEGTGLVLDQKASENLTSLTSRLAQAKAASEEQLRKAIQANAS